MILYLHRHAIAEDYHESPDSERALTGKGRRKERLVAEALRARGDRFDAIWTSPYRRARETAAILHELFPEATLSEEKRLAGHCDYAGVLDHLRRSEPSEIPRSLVLVGHEPCLMELSGLLLESSRRRGFPFKKSGIARFRVDSFDQDPSGILEWYFTPKDLIAD